jgi:hypothetical protein
LLLLEFKGTLIWQGLAMSTFQVVLMPTIVGGA